MIAAKTHISLNVSDIDKSAAWYEAFFGAPVHKRRPGYANFDLDEPALKLALQQSPFSRSDGEETRVLNHLGILVPSTDKVNAAKERLENAGLVTFSEENVTCCYARQDKIWVRDPDGNAWEVYTITDDLLGDDHEHEGASVAGCCSDKSQVAKDEEACCAPGCCS